MTRRCSTPKLMVCAMCLQVAGVLQQVLCGLALAVTSLAAS